ncbi:helix-turn-helix domain-containing protein [Paraburkholderia sp. BL25I1N1]|uniref:helix-turn-helix domain-containing protein n=1 Tax=Paraburkholderia sp. BL25I1N1 TaxID=1938804 RepID=UPI000D06E2FB|nr:helix-turn-helix domain-containing protein [Paraburkholderia sp. BL25I1N1]PRX97553.1 AraC-like DNA-binding protein [Paraburkholderia sp. BL25I1N1]
MSSVEPPSIARLSTQDVPRVQRLDYWADVLASALVPMAIRCQLPRQFEANLLSAPLGRITVTAICGSAHDALTTQRQIARSRGRSFHLVMSRNLAWTMTHRGQARILPGELVLVDSQLEFEMNCPDTYDFLNLTLPPEWLASWGSNVEGLTGRVISADSGWGRVLSSYVSQLSPEFALRAPLAESVLADQLGALLALTAHERSGESLKASPAERSLLERIHECIMQRRTESQLTASDIAAALNVSRRTLHRVLAAGSETFGQQLLKARTEAAVRMLQSRAFDHVTTAEIGRRAGFSDASHFVRVIRQRTGRTPRQLRQGRKVAEGAG